MWLCTSASCIMWGGGGGGGALLFMKTGVFFRAHCCVVIGDHKIQWFKATEKWLSPLYRSLGWWSRIGIVAWWVLGVHLVTVPSPARAPRGLTEDNLLPCPPSGRKGGGIEGGEHASFLLRALPEMHTSWVLRPQWPSPGCIAIPGKGGWKS